MSSINSIKNTPAPPAPRKSQPKTPRKPQPKTPPMATPKASLVRRAPLSRAQVGKRTDTQKMLADAERAARAEHWELLFEQQVAAYHLPRPERNALFLDGFMYRGDFIWRADRFVVEIDGGLSINQMSRGAQRRWLQEAALLQMAGEPLPSLPVQGGHHNSPEGYEHDRIRDIEAFLQGWTTLRLTPNMVKDGSGIRYVERCYKAHCQRQRRANQERSA